MPNFCGRYMNSNNFEFFQFFSFLALLNYIGSLNRFELKFNNFGKRTALSLKYLFSPSKQLSGRVSFFFCISLKVQTFWETHKIWKNLPHGFDKSADLLSKQQNHEEDFFQIMYASQKVQTLLSWSENLNMLSTGREIQIFCSGEWFCWQWD